MKKILTVSIMAVMAVTAANAEIASKAYVDQKDGALDTRVTATETAITTLNGDEQTAGSVAKKIADAIAGQDLTGYVPTSRTVNGHALSDNVTVTLGDLNVTATAAEINKLAGNEVTAADLTKLHAVTADAAELNYVDGVTSNIQTQLDAKQATLTPAQQSAVDSGITSTLVTQIGTNQTAIATLNGDANTTGSVAKAVKDAIDAEALGTMASESTDDYYTKTAADTELAKKQDKLGATNVSTTGTGNAVTAVAAADGSVTVTLGKSFIEQTAAITTNGKYALTANVTDGAVSGYGWELIQRAE